jgi:hypothetical protein
LELRAKVTAAEIAESETIGSTNTLDENELDMQFDAMLNQIVEMRNTMEQLNLQKRLLERELRTASSEILGRFATQI